MSYEPSARHPQTSNTSGTERTYVKCGNLISVRMYDGIVDWSRRFVVNLLTRESAGNLSTWSKWTHVFASTRIPL